MSFERIKLTLYNAQQGHVAYSGAWAQMKPALLYGNRLSMVVTEETRRDNHNRHFHKLIGVIAASALVVLAGGGCDLLQPKLNVEVKAVAACNQTACPPKPPLRATSTYFKISEFAIQTLFGRNAKPGLIFET